MENCSMSKREEECVYVCVYIREAYMSGFSAQHCDCVLF